MPFDFNPKDAINAQDKPFEALEETVESRLHFDIFEDMKATAQQAVSKGQEVLTDCLEFTNDIYGKNALNCLNGAVEAPQLKPEKPPTLSGQMSPDGSFLKAEDADGRIRTIEANGDGIKLKDRDPETRKTEVKSLDAPHTWDKPDASPPPDLNIELPATKVQGTPQDGIKIIRNYENGRVEKTAIGPNGLREDWSHSDGSTETTTIDPYGHRYLWTDKEGSVVEDSYIPGPRTIAEEWGTAEAS